MFIDFADKHFLALQRSAIYSYDQGVEPDMSLERKNLIRLRGLRTFGPSGTKRFT